MPHFVNRVIDIITNFRIVNVVGAWTVNFNRVLLNEEFEAEHYVLNKVMVRPPIFTYSLGYYIFAFLYSVVGLVFVILCLYHCWLDRLPGNCFGVIVSSFFIALALFSKRILIGLVRIYQHYAPEDRRRMCLFKPTCSEYAILALNKYGAIRGSVMTVNRLRRCRGDKYRIDYP